MFLKGFKIKGKNALKTSERKQLHQSILKQYPALSEQELRDYIPLTNTLYKIRIVTARGIQLYLYTVGEQPTFFRIDYDNNLYPTIFTLWRWSNLLPIVTTYEQVWPKLANGADLMCPGVVIKSKIAGNKWGNLPRGALVSINLSTNKAIHAMGVTALSSDEMLLAGGYGKCVKVMHLYNDFLHRMCSQEIQELGPPDIVVEPDDGDMSVETLTTQFNSNTGTLRQITCLDAEDNVIVLPPNASSDNKGYDPEDDVVSLSSESVVDEDVVSDNSEEHVPNEQDERIKYALLKVIKYSRGKIQLPILASTFYRIHILPSVPENYKIDVKDSTFKKLSLFLLECVRNRYLSTQMIKGNMNVIELNYSHPDVVNFELQSFDSPCLNYQQSNVAEACKSTKNITPPAEFYAITSPVLRLFNFSGFSRGDLIDPKNVRKLIVDYVRENELNCGVSNRNTVRLDSYLSEMLNKTGPIKWQELIDGVKSLMTPYHGTNENVERGKLRPIRMMVQTRTSNKKVTLVENFDMYKIDGSEFAKQCQQALGTSASVQKFKNGPKNAVQLLIQGNHINYVYKVLTEQYKVSKKNITGLEYAPKCRK